MSKTCCMRLGAVAILGLALGCGGGGGDDDGITRGAWYTNIDLLMDVCGPDIHEVTGSDVEYLTSDRVLIKVYLDETSACLAWTWELYGTRTGPDTFAMDPLTNDFLCALEEGYGYGFFDLTSATFTLGPDYDRVQGDFEGEYGGGTCTGTLYVTLTPR